MTIMKGNHDDLLLALHRAHGQALLSYVSRLTGDKALAQDIVQESLIKLWKHSSILEQESAATRAWLFTVARNLVIDDRRSARFRRESVVEVLPDLPVEDDLNAMLDVWMISDALTSLSEPHRRAVVSAYFLGNTVAEIAHQEEVPVGTIKSRLHYALAAIKISLQERGIEQ